MTLYEYSYLQGERSYRRADSVRRFTFGGVLAPNNPPAAAAARRRSSSRPGGYQGHKTRAREERETRGLSIAARARAFGRWRSDATSWVLGTGRGWWMRDATS
jgi:hypothetical protein